MLTPEQKQTLIAKLSHMDCMCWDCEKTITVDNLEGAYLYNTERNGSQMIICKECGEREGKLL